MIDDVIMHCTWRICTKKKTRETWPDWFTSHQSLYCLHYNGIHRSLWGNVWHSQQNSSNNAKFHCRKVESTRNGKLGRLSGRFQTLIWRPGETVQNLESPGLSGRVDSFASMALDRSFMKSLIYECDQKLIPGLFGSPADQRASCPYASYRQTVITDTFYGLLGVRINGKLEENKAHLQQTKILKAHHLSYISPWPSRCCKQILHLLLSNHKHTFPQSRSNLHRTFLCRNNELFENDMLIDDLRVLN